MWPVTYTPDALRTLRLIGPVIAKRMRTKMLAHPIKVFREHRALTQAQLAAAIGTSSVYISQIERGERRAGRKLLLKLSKALGVERDLLEQNRDAEAL